MKALYSEDDLELLQSRIDAYFETEHAPGFSGLAYALGFSERRSLNDYADKKDSVLSTPIKRAMLYIETDYEKLLREKACTGAIFALKNRGWSDKTETVLTTIDSNGEETGFQFVDPPNKDE